MSRNLFNDYILPSFEAWRVGNPFAFYILTSSIVLFVSFALLYLTVYLAAPLPRPPYASETTYRTVTPNGQTTEPQRLPSWQDSQSTQKDGGETRGTIDEADILISLVVPAYNEEARLGPMLEEAVAFMNEQYSSTNPSPDTLRRRKQAAERSDGKEPGTARTGWEVLVVSDGSTDKTVDVALDFASKHPGGSIRVITLKHNRGKGGAVVHGMRHVRGQYIVFADADGASRFSDVQKLLEACEKGQDSRGCAVAVGSRAHLVGSPAVVQRSWLRNALMHGFHLLIWVCTTRAVSHIGDTQCGLKMFTRQTLPYIVPHMYSEGWIFDVEMLMLAEGAGIPMVEVPIGWHEVKGSKLNVVWDSIGMAWSLAVLRAAWALGVYQTQVDDGEFDRRSVLPGRGKALVYGGMPKPY